MGPLQVQTRSDQQSFWDQPLFFFTGWSWGNVIIRESIRAVYVYLEWLFSLSCVNQEWGRLLRVLLEINEKNLNWEKKSYSV